MKKTADQIFGEFENSLVTITTIRKDEFVARIAKVVGGLKVGTAPTIPQSKFLEINRFVDRKPFSRPHLTNDFSVETIHPDDIFDIQKYIPGI